MMKGKTKNDGGVWFISLNLKVLFKIQIFVRENTAKESILVPSLNF